MEMLDRDLIKAESVKTKIKGYLMSVRRLINNDYSYGHSKNDLIDGLSESLQSCKTKLMQLRGEWFLDSRDGISWGDILGHSFDPAFLDKIVKDALLTATNVISIKSLAVIKEDRSLLISAIIKTKDGSINFTESLNALEILANDATYR